MLTVFEWIAFIFLGAYLIYQTVDIIKLWRQGKLEKVSHSVAVLVGDDDADSSDESDYIEIV